MAFVKRFDIKYDFIDEPAYVELDERPDHKDILLANQDVTGPYAISAFSYADFIRWYETDLTEAYNHAKKQIP